jgi:hypothetical protein
MAMADFTKWGIAVPPRQFSFMFTSFVADPDVPGLVDALSAVYLGGVENNEKGVRKWLETTFSVKAVTDAFVNLIETTEPKLPMHEAAGSWFTLVNDDVPRLLHVTIQRPPDSHFRCCAVLAAPAPHMLRQSTPFRQCQPALYRQPTAS